MRWTKIGADVLKRIGTIRIRDALYLLLKINTVGTGRFDGFSARYAPIYVRLFQVLARIPGAETVVFKGDGSDNEEADSRLAVESRIRKLLDRLQLGVEDAIDARTFTANSTKDKETWFTIAGGWPHNWYYAVGTAVLCVLSHHSVHRSCTACR